MQVPAYTRKSLETKDEQSEAGSAQGSIGADHCGFSQAGVFDV